MKVTLTPRGLEIDNARICFRNFRGLQSQYNAPGARNFALIIAGGELDDGREIREVDSIEMAEALQDHMNRDGAGWNVKIRPPKVEGEDSFVYLPVKVNFNGHRGPHIELHSGNNHAVLTEDTIDCLDTVEISYCDMDINASDGIVNGKPYRTAYLEELHVVQELSRFRNRYAREEYPEENGPEEDIPFPFN